MMKLQQRLFEFIGTVTERLSKVGTPIFGKWLERVFPAKNENLDWAGDADWARLQQEPLRARAMVKLVLLTVAILTLWATFADIDEVTRGEAKVVPSSQVQIIQSLDGGMVDAILVKEGQVVSPGDVMVRIDSTRFASNMQESRASLMALQARAARLEALTRGTPFLPSKELLKEAPDLVEAERRLYDSRRSEISAQGSIAKSQLAQRQQELNEVRAKRDQAARAMELTQQEYNATKPLLKSGAVSEVEVLRLEKDVARLRGERDQASAQISRVQEAITESTRKIEEVDLGPRNQMRNELADVMSKISSLSQGKLALEDKVKLAEIRSPVKGTVKRLLFNTVGGVVLPGKDILEIVPLNEALILEARIKPADIAFLRPGQVASVKLTAYDYSRYGGMTGTVEQISADTITDEKGNPFYLVRVKTDKASFSETLPIIPGMVAQIDILTGKKSVISYLFRPVFRITSNALSEK